MKKIIYLAIALFNTGLLYAQNNNFIKEEDYLKINYLQVQSPDKDISIDIVAPDNTNKKVQLSELPVIFSAHKPELLKNFPHVESTSTIAKIELGGKISFAAASLSQKNSQYQVTISYNVYKTVQVKNVSYKVGYGMRLIANILTKESGIDLGDLFKLGVAASKKKVTGRLHVEIMGLVSTEIGTLVPFLTDLSESGVNSCIQVFTSIKAKVGDAGTFIIPQILEVKNDDQADVQSNRASLLNK